MDLLACKLWTFVLLCVAIYHLTSYLYHMHIYIHSSRQALKKRSPQPSPIFDASILQGLSEVEIIYKMASLIIPKCLDVDLIELMARDDREEMTEARAIEAQKSVLEDMAQRRSQERQRWMTNRCAREFHITNGEFKVRKTKRWFVINIYHGRLRVFTINNRDTIKDTM